MALMKFIIYFNVASLARWKSPVNLRILALINLSPSRKGKNIRTMVISFTLSNILRNLTCALAAHFGEQCAFKLHIVIEKEKRENKREGERERDKKAARF